MLNINAVLVFMLFLLGCSTLQESESNRLKRQNRTSEGIYRCAKDRKLQLQAPQQIKRAPYPWEEVYRGVHPKITREYFRCRGSSLHLVYYIEGKEKERMCISDCNGRDGHSLPLKEGKEFIFPILIDLLNYIQNQTNNRVVITSGHRCPQHNTYVDPTFPNRSSKHMIGAEVDFYVAGWEYEPQKVVQVIQQYYREQPKYAQNSAYSNFQTYEKLDYPLKGSPIYNREIFVKVFSSQEGRNWDNAHPYPYISLQVRFDTERKEMVQYTWDKAMHNFLRW